MNTLNTLAEEVLCLIMEKGTVKVKELQDELCLAGESTGCVVKFLARFNFAELDESRLYLSPSKKCKAFFEGRKSKQLLVH